MLLLLKEAENKLSDAFWPFTEQRPIEKCNFRIVVILFP